MRRRSAPPRHEPPNPADSLGRDGADGAIQAMDHVANWVRFADGKATILTAGLGVLTTLVISNLDVVVRAANVNWPGGVLVLGLGFVALGTFIWTLFWLLRAILPQRRSSEPGINRFAWPTMAETSAAEVITHAMSEPPGSDAWGQTVSLSSIAQRKFTAIKYAVVGLGVFFGASVLLVGISVARCAS